MGCTERLLVCFFVGRELSWLGWEQYALLALSGELIFSNTPGGPAEATVLVSGWGKMVFVGF